MWVAEAVGVPAAGAAGAAAAGAAAGASAGAGVSAGASAGAAVSAGAAASCAMAGVKANRATPAANAKWVFFIGKMSFGHRNAMRPARGQRTRGTDAAN